MHWIRHKPTTLQVLPSKAGTQANSRIEAAAPPMAGPKILSQDPSRSAQQSELCRCVRYWKRHCKPGWFPATASLSEQSGRLQWLLQKCFYKLWLGVKDDVTLSMGLIEQAVALLAYILCKIFFKKKISSLGSWAVSPGWEFPNGCQENLSSPLPFQGSGSPGYFANNSSSHPTACSHFLPRTCLWLSTAHHLSGWASHFSVANWRPSYKLDTISNVMKEKSFYGPILFLLFLACGNTSTG